MMEIAKSFSDDIVIDCKHTASMIKLSIERGDDWTAFLLYNVDIDNFDKQFIPCLADSLGGSVIADNTIMYNGKTLSFRFTWSYRFDNTEVIVNYS